ncbi:MAG: DUF1501 domain-containing protein [Planctomycetes bacterium]|nr:DUF1501 domain-containing protein [Planctomycetota bacterium]
MLRILGSPRALCDNLTRREMLCAGGLGMFSLGLPDLWRLQAAQAFSATPKHAQPPPRRSHFGRAKRVILLYLYGAAAQHELFDPKPLARAEIRGDFRPGATVVPGLHICEHLPRLARVIDRCTVLRSMSHPFNIHSAAYTMTGVERVDIPMELNPRDVRHWPSFGSVIDYLQQQTERTSPKVPRNIGLPFPFSSRSPQFQRAGPFGGFLGPSFNPVWTEWEGTPTTVVSRWNGAGDVTVADPYLEVNLGGRFLVSSAARAGPDLTLDRLHRRRSLLQQFEDARRQVDASPAARNLDRYQSMAYSLLASPEMRRALDLEREPAALRERYGWNVFGQATLAGRRLLEAGATVVTVIWDEITIANTAWDTHFRHFERLRDELLPGLDMALSSLLLDLEARGMLDDTLVLCLTEHGRTPLISNTARGAGREHWSNVYSNLMAGAGIAKGRVVGSSDRDGAFVRDDPVSPKDILCTLYHLLGINPHTTIPDRLGRPSPLVAEGRVLYQALE